MAARLTVFVGLVAMASAGVTGSAVAQPESSLQPCVRAQALLDAGYLADAQTAFKEDLGKSPCALAGLAVVKVKQTQEFDEALTRIRRLWAEGFAEEAHKQLQALVAALPDKAIPTDISGKEFDEAVTRIRRLEAEGFEAEARKQVQALVAEFPEKAIPADIRALDQPIGWWREVGGNVGPLIRVAIEIAAVLIIAFLVARALWAVVARLLRPSYTIRDISGVAETARTQESGLLATELARIASTGGGNQVHRVPANEGDFELPDALTSAYPQTKVVAALVSLLDRILPRRLREISATVLPADPVRGTGLTVAISQRNGRQMAEMTFWEADFGKAAARAAPVEPLERLILPAAVWLGYQRAMGGTAQSTARLGTEQWKSYAYFAIGDRHQQNGEMSEARQAYFQALDADAANLGARINLAGLLLHRGPKEEGPAAETSRLELAGWLLTDAEMVQRMTPSSDAIRQPAQQRRQSAAVDPLGPFLLPFSLLRFELSSAFSADARARAAERQAAKARGMWQETRWRWRYLSASMYLARKMPSEALKAATELWNEIAPPKPEQAGPELQEFAAHMRWPTFVLERSAQMEHAGRVDPVALSAMKNEWWTANTLYNLACYHARAATHERKDDHLQRARRYLCDGIDRATEPKLMLEMAETDPILHEVMKLILPGERADLVGEKLPDQQHTAEANRGRGIGIEIREAVRGALTPRDGERSD